MSQRSQERQLEIDTAHGLGLSRDRQRLCPTCERNVSEWAFRPGVQWNEHGIQRQCWSCRRPEIARSEIHRSTTRRIPKSARRLLSNDPCVYCHQPAQTLDHINPYGWGGSNHWSNMTAACYDCNQAKDNLSLLEFLLGQGLQKKPRYDIFDNKIRAASYMLNLVELLDEPRWLHEFNDQDIVVYQANNSPHDATVAISHTVQTKSMESGNTFSTSILAG